MASKEFATWWHNLTPEQRKMALANAGAPLLGGRRDTTPAPPPQPNGPPIFGERVEDSKAPLSPFATAMRDYLIPSPDVAAGFIGHSFGAADLRIERY